MKQKNKFVHPYIPNSASFNSEQIIQALGLKDIDELYGDIPERLRFRGKMNIPPAMASEQDLRKHLVSILNKNTTCEEYISFLGAGCAHHYVPAICDEITGRAEFLTAYAGEPYEDHGRFQVLFEFESLMAELLDVDVVSVPTYDWGQAASSSIRMAGRIAGKDEMLIADNTSPDRLKVIKNYCEPVMKITLVKHDQKTGMLDLADLKSKISSITAGVYFENPAYLGFLEEQGDKIANLIHQVNGVVVVGTDPVSLGVVAPPSHYGADITCGDIQALGNHMYFGGSMGGFIGTRDEEKYVMEYAWRLFGIAKTSVEGEWGFGDVAYNRTSFSVREKGKEFVGTAAALYGISAAVYLSLMGPKGMKELGQLILQNALYAQKGITSLPGVRLRFRSTNFKEFVVDFSSTGKSVAHINKALLAKGVFGGMDLSQEFPLLKNCALYCVTEMHSKPDIDTLISALHEILK
ncbi:MAG: aminomethyl-transferring glycine dehydrogenase subunit GcvPA [Bacteroidales bacterium]